MVNLKELIEGDRVKTQDGRIWSVQRLEVVEQPRVDWCLKIKLKQENGDKQFSIRYKQDGTRVYNNGTSSMTIVCTDLDNEKPKVDLTKAVVGDHIQTRKNETYVINSIKQVDEDKWGLLIAKLPYKLENYEFVYNNNGERCFVSSESMDIDVVFKNPLVMSEIKGGDTVTFLNGQKAIVLDIDRASDKYSNSYIYGIKFVNHGYYDFGKQDWLTNGDSKFDINPNPDFIYYQDGGTYRGTVNRTEPLNIVSHETAVSIWTTEQLEKHEYIKARIQNEVIDLNRLKINDIAVIDNKRYVVHSIKYITENTRYSDHYQVFLGLLPHEKPSESITRKFRRNGEAVISNSESRRITRVIKPTGVFVGPNIESFDLPDHNVKSFDITQMDYATTEKRVVGYYANEFDSHILDALSNKSVTAERLSLQEFLRLPTITNQPTIEETKMTETLKAKTGKEILDEGIAAVDISAGNQLRNMIVDTTGKIRQREMWVANRTKQIQQLKEIQKEAVKSYDEGTFAHNSKAYNERINAIENERVS